MKKAICKFVASATALTMTMFWSAAAYAATSNTQYDNTWMRGSKSLYGLVTNELSQMLVVLLVMGAAVMMLMNQGNGTLRTICLAVLAGGVVLFAPDFVSNVMGKPVGVLF